MTAALDILAASDAAEAVVNHLDFLSDLAIVMLVAGVVTILCHKLKQPVVLGYIIAGVIIGPHTPPYNFIKDGPFVGILSELGIIFLMFGLGLHFSLRKLASVGMTAVIAATMEIVVMFGVGYLAGRAFGWNTMDAVFLGAILSISSTTIIIKALGELGMLREKFASLIFGILIVEDILAIAMLALLSGLGKPGGVSFGAVGMTLGQLSIFLAMTLVIGLLAVPPVLRYVARFRSDEMLLVTTLGLLFGVCLLTIRLDYSVALGAFLIGAVIAEAREGKKIETLIAPLRDMFSAVFFVAIGLLIDPAILWKYKVEVAVITAVVVVGKIVSCSIGTFLAGNDTKTSLRVGMGLAQIGEFSFIIATLGLRLGRTSDFLYPIAVAVSVLTTLLTPYLIKAAPAAANAFENYAPKSITNFLHAYSGWTEALGMRQTGNMRVKKLLRKWALQLSLNIALLTGLFIVAAYFGTRASAWLPVVPPSLGGARTAVWLAAVLLALPVLIALFRKLRAVAMVLAEMSVRPSGNPEQTETLRRVMANTILITGSTAIVFWILLLTSALLPPWRVLVALLVLIVVTAAIAWRFMVRLYAKAQISLTETLTAEHGDRHEHDAPLPALLRDAALETVTLDARSPAGGKIIRELQLRTRSGASVVGIDRPGAEPLINPGPDEELRPGDALLLIGTAGQINAARALLAPKG